VSVKSKSAPQVQPFHNSKSGSINIVVNADYDDAIMSGGISGFGFPPKRPKQLTYGFRLKA